MLLPQRHAVHTQPYPHAPRTGATRSARGTEAAGPLDRHHQPPASCRASAMVSSTAPIGADRCRLSHARQLAVRGRARPHPAIARRRRSSTDDVPARDGRRIVGGIAPCPSLLTAAHRRSEPSTHPMDPLRRRTRCHQRSRHARSQPSQTGKLPRQPGAMRVV